MPIEIHLKTNKEVSTLINISLVYLLWKTSGNNERVEQEGKWKSKLWKRCLLSTMCRMSFQSIGRVPLFFKVCIREDHYSLSMSGMFFSWNELSSSKMWSLQKMKGQIFSKYQIYLKDIRKWDVNFLWLWMVLT